MIFFIHDLVFLYTSKGDNINLFELKFIITSDLINCQNNIRVNVLNIFVLERCFC